MPPGRRCSTKRPTSSTLSASTGRWVCSPIRSIFRSTTMRSTPPTRSNQRTGGVSVAISRPPLPQNREMTMSRYLLPLMAGLMLASPLALADDPKRGGEITILYKDDFDSMDPAIGYTVQSWTPIKAVFDGLMDYKPGTSDLVPDLAESYDISDDGKQYTFHLRKGVKFHNGRELKAADIKYSIERVCNGKTQSPGAGYFTGIPGCQDMLDGKATEMSGITTPDDYTVVFQLNEPNATMLHVFALNFSFAVPKEVAEQYGPDFTHHAVGTGAYKMTSYEPGQQIVLERNPNWNKEDGRPYVDKITLQFGLEPVTAVLRIEKNEADMLGEIFPPGK